ncbi:hypothetical protein [Burkholderia ambifaria]|uniref:hypothetical protein n=1 Tax=Burkholderia ambifaria TaxID=152480 RepID=UPI0015919482|nr:hypothetical protein [Burkholderia ambifaria]
MFVMKLLARIFNARSLPALAAWLATALTAVCLLGLITACGGGDSDAPAPRTGLTALRVDTPPIAYLRAGDTLALTGAGFVDNMRVTIRSEPVRDIQRRSAELFQLSVPALKIVRTELATVEIMRSDGQRASVPVTLVPTVTVQSVLPLHVRANDAITVSGQHLNLLRAVQFGSRPARFEATPDGRSLTVAVPRDAPDGAITAIDCYGFTYTLTAGLVVERQNPVGELPKIDSVHYGQSHLRPSADVFEVTPGRALMVRARVAMHSAGSSGQVVLTVAYSSGKTRTHTMCGVPLSPNLPHGALQDVDYTVVVPGEDVCAGMQLTVEVASPGQPIRHTIVPRVAAPTHIQVELVPLSFGIGKTPGNVSRLVEHDAFKRQLQAMFPIAQIDVVSGAPYALLRQTKNITVNALWQLGVHQQVNSVHHFVIGILPGAGEVVEEGMEVGLGGIGAQHAVVWDGAADVVLAAAHELAHNLGRPHPDDARTDEVFVHVPHRNGIGPHWGVDLTADPVRLMDPARHYDLMSYDFPQWIGSYTYDRLAGDVRSRLGVNAAAAAPPMHVPVVTLAGVLFPDHVMLGGARYPRGEIDTAPIPAAEAGDGTVLELAWADGTRTVYPLTVHPWSEPTRAGGTFALSIADAGAITSMQVRRGARILYEGLPSLVERNRPTFPQATRAGSA